MYDVMGVEIELGESVALGSLRLYPLTTRQVTLPPYLTGPEASALGRMQVAELDPPEVPFLAVTNLAEVPILLVEGEMLVGGDQDRTMNVTVLCPPLETTVVPVSCVEAGRWGARRTMASTGRHAPGSLRSRKTRSQTPMSDPAYARMSDQGEVWRSVDSIAEAQGVTSDTSALEDVHRAAGDRIALELALLTPAPGQTGVLVLNGGRVVGMDLFSRPETLACYLSAIVAGHALDSAEAADGADPLAAITKFLAQVGATDQETGVGVGLGEEVVLRGGISGVGLTYEGTLVHLAAFPGE